TQTGRALYPEYESIGLLIERSVKMVCSHPSARGVDLKISSLSSPKAWVDTKKLSRAIYNLLLNGCQAAGPDDGHPAVTIGLREDDQFIYIRITDNGPGVPYSIRQTLFLPFVS